MSNLASSKSKSTNSVFSMDKHFVQTMLSAFVNIMNVVEQYEDDKVVINTLEVKDTISKPLRNSIFQMVNFNMSYFLNYDSTNSTNGKYVFDIFWSYDNNTMQSCKYQRDVIKELIKQVKYFGDDPVYMVITKYGPIVVFNNFIPEKTYNLDKYNGF